MIEPEVTTPIASGMRKRRWLNPYLTRVQEFSDRIFTPDPQSAELSAMRSRIASQQRLGQRLIVELGSGSGQHLIELARRHSDTAFWGFELRFKRAVRTVEKATRFEISNLCIARTDAARLAELFEPDSVSGIYVNFPDPWLRPKQWKHRMLSAEMLSRAHVVLQAGGFFSAKTDSKEYFDWFREQAEADSRFEVVEESYDLAASKYAAGNIVTEFESMFLSQRLPIHYLRLQKA